MQACSHTPALQQKLTLQQKMKCCSKKCWRICIYIYIERERERERINQYSEISTWWTKNAWCSWSIGIFTISLESSTTPKSPSKYSHRWCNNYNYQSIKYIWYGGRWNIGYVSQFCLSNIQGMYLVILMCDVSKHCEHRLCGLGVQGWFYACTQTMRDVVTK